MHILYVAIQTAYNQLVCMVHFMSVVTMDEVKCEVCRFVCAQKEKKVKVGRDSDRSELFGSDMTSASDEQVSSCVTLAHMYCTPRLSKSWVGSNMCAMEQMCLTIKTWIMDNALDFNTSFNVLPVFLVRCY